MMKFGDWWRESPMSKSRPELYGICEAVWLAAQATRPEGTESGMVKVPRALLHRIQVLCGDLGVQVALHNILAVDAEDTPKPQPSDS